MLIPIPTMHQSDPLTLAPTTVSVLVSLRTVTASARTRLLQSGTLASSMNSGTACFRSIQRPVGPASKSITGWLRATLPASTPRKLRAARVLDVSPVLRPKYGTCDLIYNGKTEPQSLRTMSASPYCPTVTCLQPFYNPTWSTLSTPLQMPRTPSLVALLSMRLLHR